MPVVGCSRLVASVAEHLGDRDHKAFIVFYDEHARGSLLPPFHGRPAWHTARHRSRGCGCTVGGQRRAPRRGSRPVARPPTEELSTTLFRPNFEKALEKVRFEGRRIVLVKFDDRCAAVVPIRDLNRLECTETQGDVPSLAELFVYSRPK